jgi:hypothetical protein
MFVSLGIATLEQLCVPVWKSMKKQKLKFNLDIKMLPNIITEPPLFIPDHAIKRTLHIVFVASSRSASARITNYRSTAYTAASTLAPFLPKPASLALCTRCIGIRSD